MTAISGISAAMGAVNTALEQFDRAILSTVTAVADPNGGPNQPGPVRVPDGLVGMDTAKLATQAALAAANASVSMLDEVIKLGDYEHKSDAESPSQPQAQASASQESSTQSAGLLAFVQTMQSPEPAETEPAPPAPEEQFQPGWTQAE
jgi:hypothetical protein